MKYIFVSHDLCTIFIVTTIIAISDLNARLMFHGIGVLEASSRRLVFARARSTILGIGNPIPRDTNHDERPVPSVRAYHPKTQFALPDGDKLITHTLRNNIQHVTGSRRTHSVPNLTLPERERCIALLTSSMTNL